MAYTGLDNFIKELESKGELIRIKEFVDPNLEISEITDRFCKLEGGGKALLFENTGTNFPVLTNMFGSDARIASALGFTSPNQVASEIDALFKTLTSPKQSLLDKLKMLPTLRKVSRWMPKRISGRGICQQVVHMHPDLSILPILKTWPHDGGPFVTLPMVITKDPTTEIRNVGMYRMQVFSERQTGMHWHRHKTGATHYSKYKKLGEQMPIAVALGGDPAYTYAATAPLPENIDEFLLAGFLRKKPVKLVKGITVDIDVPYDADIIIEGYVDPEEELMWEGPFGDHTGFYSLADWYPKFHVTCITHKRKAIYPATVVGVPPMEDTYLAKATERIFLSPIKLTMLPEIEDMYLPEEGVAHNIAVIKINKSFPAQAYKVASALWGAGQMMFNKIMVVVNGDVDIHLPKELAKTISENFNPATDIFFGKGPLDVLDHSSEKPGIGGKILIDATTKFPEEIDGDCKNKQIDSEEAAELLSSISPPIQAANSIMLNNGVSLIIVSIDKSEGAIATTLAQRIIEVLGEATPKVLVVVDKEVPVDCLSTVCWYVAGNIDPTRDCSIVKKSEGVTTLVVNGTRKSFSSDKFPRDWPNIVVSSLETIKKINDKWPELGLGNRIDSPSAKFLGMDFSEGAVLKDV